MFPPELVSCAAMSSWLQHWFPQGLSPALVFLSHMETFHFCLCGCLHWVLLDLPPRVSFPAEVYVQQALQAAARFLQGLLSSALTRCLGLFCPSIRAHLLLLPGALAL